MKKTDMVMVHQRLTENIKKYIYIIKQEYGEYMSKEILVRLNSINDYNQILKIFDYGEISAYANSENIMMPLCADRLLNLVSMVPGYGINKNHIPYNEKNIVINNNTFLSYLKHVYISGTNAEGYYDDLLLHETMHFCGSDGGSVLKEGLTEYLTRTIASKYNLRTNSCGYPKEVKLAHKLIEVFGFDMVKKLSFMNNFNQEMVFIAENLGSEYARLYSEIYIGAEKEFNEKYYSHMKEFSGLTGIVKKVLFYKKIDYSNIYKLIEDFNISLQDKNTKKYK